jgi:hypothetical protein
MQQHGTTMEIINYVIAQRFSLFRHTNRMPEVSIVQKIYKWTPFTSRPAERPKSSPDGKMMLEIM